jgi:hypothetical protein
MKPVQQMSGTEIFEYVFDNYSEHEFDKTNHLANAAQSILDELSVVTDLMTSGDTGLLDLPAIRRILLRAADRLRIALRFEAAAIEAAESATRIPRAPGQQRLFVADSTIETDAVSWSSLRIATTDDLAELGYVPRDAPTSGIHRISSIMPADGWGGIVIGNIAPSKARPAWCSEPLWRLLQAITPVGADAIAAIESRNSAEYRGLVSVTTPSGSAQTVEVAR